MSREQQELLRELTDKASELANDWSAYWHTYSDAGTWQFWVVVGVFIIPLLALVFLLDRQKAFRIGFFGLIIHVTATYIDLYGTTHRMWEYPYKIAPFPPVSFGLDASLIPVSYMLLYQWTIRQKKNYYLFSILLSVAFALLFKPLISWLGLFKLVEWNYFQLLLLYIIAGLIGKWMTDLFNVAQDRS